MSRFTILKSFLTVTFGIFLGYTGMQYAQSKNDSHRNIASMAVSKMAVDQFSKTVFDLRVKRTDIGLTDADFSTVAVSIEAYKTIPVGLPYTWNLPEGVEIVEGNQSGVLPNFEANQVYNLVLKVKGFNKAQKSFISFSVKGHIESAQISREILLSSRPEDSFEYIVQQFEKSKRAEVNANGKVGKAGIYKGPIDPAKVVR